MSMSIDWGQEFLKQLPKQLVERCHYEFQHPNNVDIFEWWYHATLVCRVTIGMDGSYSLHGNQSVAKAMKWVVLNKLVQYVVQKCVLGYAPTQFRLHLYKQALELRI